MVGFPPLPRHVLLPIWPPAKGKWGRRHGSVNVNECECNFSETLTVSCQVNGPRAAIAHHVCFNVANGFGDRAVGKQMADLYGWDKTRAFGRIGECPSAAFITGAEFAYVWSSADPFV